MNGEKPGERPGVTIGEHWRARFGAKVRRVSLDPGFSCPNRDGTVGAGGCVYCDEASFSPSAGDPRPVGEQLRAAIYAHEQKKPGLLYAAYLQPRTNTHAPLAEIAKVLDEIAREPRAAVLCIGTRPDAVPDGTLALLADGSPGGGPPAFVHPRAAVGGGAILGPGAVIEEGATVGTGATVRRAIVWPGAAVRPGAAVENGILTPRGFVPA